MAMKLILVATLGLAVVFTSGPAASQGLPLPTASWGGLTFKGSTNWEALPPANQAGAFLQTLGPSSPPQWSNQASQSFLLPTQATNTFLGNTTGHNASPTPNTVSQILNTLGYDIIRPPLFGSIVYKDITTGNWQALQPGVAGASLISGGAGGTANPYWAVLPQSVTPGAAGTCLISNGPTAIPSYQSCVGTITSTPNHWTATQTFDDAVGHFTALYDLNSADTQGYFIQNNVGTPKFILGMGNNGLGSLTTRLRVGGVNGAISFEDAAGNTDAFLYPYPTLNGSNQPDKALFTIGASGATRNDVVFPTTLEVLDGSLGAPITTVNTPTVNISKWQNLTAGGDGSGSAALFVQNVSVAGDTQNVAIVGSSVQNSAADTVALYGAAEQNSPTGHWSAFGAFLNATATSSGTSAIGINTGVFNNTGNDVPYNPTTGTQIITAWDNGYSGGASKNLGSAAVNVRASNGQWDVGLAFWPGNTTDAGIKTASIQDDSSSSNIIYAHMGAHVNGINIGAGATFSGNAWASPGSSIDGTGIGTFKQLKIPGSSSGTVTFVAQAAAGTPTITAPNASGTIAISASSPIVLSATTGNLTCPTCLTNTPAALTKTDDTNVTLTLGGTPATALLQATSITVGWTGTLAYARLASAGTNTVLGNATSGTASVTALSVGSCSTAASALTWTTNTGFGCNTAVAAATSTIVNDTTTNASMFPVWVTANTGALPLKVSSTELSFNPSTGTLSTVAEVVAASGATSSVVVTPLSLSVLGGSTGSRLTSVNSPTALISRWDGGSSGDGSGSAALFVSSVGNGAIQNVALVATSTNTATADNVALYGYATSTPSAGNHAAFAAFLRSDANNSTASAITVNTATFNKTGADVPYSSTLPPSGQIITAFDIGYDGTTTKLGGAAIQIRASNGKWDVGVGFMAGDIIRTASIQDDTNAINIIYGASGSHTNGVNFAGATFSGSAFSSPGFAVSGSGVVAASNSTGAYEFTASKTGTNANSYGMAVTTTGSFSFDDITGVAQRFSIAKTTGQVAFSTNITSTSIGSGTVITAGGVGVGENLFVAGTGNFAGTLSETGGLLVISGGAGPTLYFAPASGATSNGSMIQSGNSLLVYSSTFGAVVTANLTAGGINVAGGYSSNGTAGVDCTGVTAGTVTVAKGLVTHC